MKKKTNDQLSQHIRDALHNHEETYVLGSWERFQQHKKRKNRSRKRKLYIAIAATVLSTLAFGFALMNIKPVPSEQITDRRPMEQLDPPKNEYSPLSPEPEQSTLESHLNNTHTQIQTTENNLDEAGVHVSNPETRSYITPKLQHKPVSSTLLTHTIDQPPSHIMEIISDTKREPSSDHPSLSGSENLVFNTIVKAENLQNPTSINRQKDLVFSIAYASVMNIHDSQTNLGSGGGFYTDWNFARNFSISSGVFIAQNRLTYNGKSGAQLMTFSDETETSPHTSDDLTSVQLDLVNLEVPLNVRYYLTNKLSFSAGVASMAFLKEKYNYHFEYEQKVQVFEDFETAGIQPTTKIVNVKTSESQSEPSLESMNWAAFYTFSVGYQQDIFNRYTASFEPFVKIPAGQITSRNISYTTGGIQLKISF